MKGFLISAIALATLGGCVTYDQVGSSGPGGYYSGSPSYEYSYPDGYYGGYGYGGFGGYGYSPGFYGGYSRPYYVIRQSSRPPRHDHHGHDGRDPAYRPPAMSDEEGPRANWPNRQRPPNGRPLPQRAEGTAPQSRPISARPAGQSQSRPAPQSLPPGSHFRNRPVGSDL